MALSVAVAAHILKTEPFNSFSSFGHIIDMAGLSQTSPSPSVSSESSGIGSLGSLKAESVNSDSLPASPQTTEKKIFEPIAKQLVDKVVKVAEDEIVDVKINYGGRDILDLFGNITDSQWNYRPAELPPNNAALFLANRSQYHRLGPYGTTVKYVYETCSHCGFTSVAAAKDC